MNERIQILGCGELVAANRKNTVTAEEARDERGRWTDSDGYTATAKDGKLTVTSKAGKTQQTTLSQFTTVDKNIPTPVRTAIRNNGGDPDKYVWINGQPFRAGVKPIVEQHVAELQSAAEKAKQDFNIKVPGLEEIRKADAEHERYHYLFNKTMERDDGGRFPAKPTSNPDALRKQYPAAAAFLHAEGYSRGSHFAMSAAGTRAMERIKNGEPHEQVMKDMENEWSEAARRSVDNS